METAPAGEDIFTPEYFREKWQKIIIFLPYRGAVNMQGAYCEISLTFDNLIGERVVTPCTEKKEEKNLSTVHFLVDSDIRGHLI